MAAGRRLKGEDIVQRTMDAQAMASGHDDTAHTALGEIAMAAVRRKDRDGQTPAELGTGLWRDLLSAGWIDPPLDVLPTSDSLWPEIMVELIRARCQTCGGIVQAVNQVPGGANQLLIGGSHVQARLNFEASHSCEVAEERRKKSVAEQDALAEERRSSAKEKITHTLREHGWSQESVDRYIDDLVNAAQELG